MAGAMFASQGVSMAGSFINDILDFSSFLTSSSHKKKQVKLQLEQLKDDMGAAYRSNLDQLIELGGAYQDVNLQIRQANANLGSANEWLSRYGDYYDYIMGQEQLKVDQGINDIESLLYQGLNTYQTQNANWQNQLTRAGEIGQSGGTAKLLAAAQRQNIINTFGEDMTVDAEGGTFGRQLQLQNDALDLTRKGMEQTRLDLEADRQSVLNSVDVINESLTALEDAKSYYYNSFRDSVGSVMKQGWQIGETYNDLDKAIEQYRQYFAASDEEYDKIKAELLDQYKPIDFELRKNSVTYDMSDENSHITDYFYDIYDKSTGELATQDQIDAILRQYAGNVKDSMIYTTVGRHGDKKVLSNKAINAIMKNSNYKERSRG